MTRTDTANGALTRSAGVSFTLDRYGHLYLQDWALRDRLDRSAQTTPAPPPRVSG